MKNICICAIAALLIGSACAPIEDREEMKGGITADQLNISAIPEIRDGVNSNYVILNSDGNPCLSSWDYGSGTLLGTGGRVQLLLTGDNDIIYIGLNPDGTKITKTLTVHVDRTYDVAPEWALLCGSGEKVWKWDDQAPAVWGNGGYLGNVAPGWWTVSIGDMEEQTPGEGAGASMTFALKGASLTKNKSDGSTESGSFSFDMSKTTLNAGGDALWGIGKLTTTRVTVLSGKQPNADNAPVNSYDILKLTNEELALGFPEPGAGAGGTAWYWLFRAE
ncbi:MAG: hypothetical protein LBS05_08535 [Tannerellaceae bacterium]|jgi:hypothetical protein|nr:hypothetical protein [Tannerellaceae bacterium]